MAETDPDGRGSGSTAKASGCQSQSEAEIPDGEGELAQDPQALQETDGQEKEPWRRLCLKENVLVQNYTNLRELTEAILGEARDPGVYTFKQQQRKGSLQCLAWCKPAACLDCSREVMACYSGNNLEILARGKRGTLQKPTGGALFTVAEVFAIEKHMQEGGQMTAPQVRQALKKEKLALRCTARQLANIM